jgi:AcrR family transcriptional regulator
MKSTKDAQKMRRTKSSSKIPDGFYQFAPEPGDDSKYRKGIATREQIFAVAIDMFFEKGFSDTSIRQLINKLGKSSSVIYNHFADKEDILFKITCRTGEKTLAMLSAVREQNSDPEACLKAMITSMIHLVSHPSMVKEIAIFRNESHHLPTRKQKIINHQHLGIVHQFEGVLIQMAKERRSGVNSKVAAFSILSVINWFYLWYDKNGKMSLDAICDEIIRFIFRGLE